MHLPRSGGGIVGFVIGSVLMVVVGLFIVQRVSFLRNIVSPSSAS